ncbi:MAG TPA: acyl-CoA dehydrogenase family protein, partial [Nitrososphaerales archaeon]
MGILRPSVSEYSLTLSEEHREIQKLAREFAENEIAPIADKIDKEDKIPAEIVRKIGELGFLGVPYPAEFGGVGSDYLSMAIVIEELARISCAVSVLPVAHTLAAMPIYIHGTEEQKKKYLIPLAKGEKLGAHAMTEAAAGSDVAGIKSVARKEGNKYIINGSKVFCTNGDVAETFVIFARTNPPPKEKRQLGISAFIVERGMKGFTVGKSIGKTGIHGSQSVELIMEDLVVPEENLLGEEDKGFYLALDCYDHG